MSGEKKTDDTTYDARPRFSPWDDRSLDNLLPTAEHGRRVAAFAWIERGVAEAMRTLAKRASAPVSQVLERQAALHDWHATVWEEHLTPGTAGPGVAADAVPEGCEHLLEVDGILTGASDDVEMLAGLSRVLAARAIAAYAFHRAATGTEAGPEAARWLEIVLDDEQESKNELELYLQSLVAASGAGAELPERLGRWQARLEAPIVRAGGLLGPGTLGGGSLTATSTVTPKKD